MEKCYLSLLVIPRINYLNWDSADDGTLLFSCHSHRLERRNRVCSFVNQKSFSNCQKGTAPRLAIIYFRAGIYASYLVDTMKIFGRWRRPLDCGPP